ncbi:ribosome maturation factor RimP [Caldisericum exile]|uniref:Ribosome maturation factor RimP n=1 Tax=Caldisericum exile (strain DSM 21853 / NBRC 104410 / AZM16c01) TaxID=511051 RepID=A0A7U6GFG0_CALEA|nr:ribosome assembly cofactor RimP [Caldisericum exile]BAL81428.1 hypothetical protein CSE_13020 [Caldisericum exile AZM16c01]
MERIESIVRKNAERFNMMVIELSITADTIEAIVYRRTKGITVGDLEELTREIQRDLKAIGVEGVYDINLSTPGLDRVLKDRAELDIFEGREVRFTYEDEKGQTVTKEGILRGNAGDEVNFEVDGVMLSVPFSKIVRVALFERMFEKRKGGKK